MTKKKRKGAIASGGSKRRRKILLRIADRDDWLCHLCGEPVQRKRTMNDPMAPSLDHVVRHKDGGTDTEDNLKLAHRKCNSENPPWN